jgi:hypothetical protein
MEPKGQPVMPLNIAPGFRVNTDSNAREPATQSTAIVPFELDSQLAATFKHLGVKLSWNNLSIPKGLETQDLLGLAKALATVQERIVEIPQWLWGSFWHYSGFSHGDRKTLTEDPEWAGPTYDNWERQGAAYQLFLEWSSSQDIHTQNLSRDRFLLPSYFMKALLALPENRKNLLNRCASGEIQSVRELEAEIKGIRDSLPVPVPDSKSKAKRVTTTDVEAQVQPEEKSSQESSSEHAIKLAKAKLALNKNADMRDADNRIRRHGGDKLADAILLLEIEISTTQIYALAQHAPAELAALAPKILEAKRFPLPTPEAALRNKLQALFGQALERVRPKLGNLLGDQYKAAFQKAVGEATYDKLLAFADIEPGAALGEIDPEKINQAIARCHEHNKNKPSNQEAEISLDDILALRAESTPSAQDQEQSARSETERSREELAATQRILAILCAGNNPDNLASWRRALAKVPTNDLLDWNRESGDNVRRVAGLITGDWEKGVAKALRIVRDVIDDRTPLSRLKNNCNAEGGRWEHTDGTFLFAVTRADRDVLNRTLCLTVKDSAKYEQIKEALEDNALDLSLADLAGLSSLNKELLERILIHLLYGSQQQPREVEISFEE